MAQNGPDVSITVQERLCRESLHQGGDKAMMSNIGNKPKEHPGYDGAEFSCRSGINGIGKRPQ